MINSSKIRNIKNFTKAGLLGRYTAVATLHLTGHWDPSALRQAEIKVLTSVALHTDPPM